MNISKCSFLSKETEQFIHYQEKQHKIKLLLNQLKMQKLFTISLLLVSVVLCNAQDTIYKKNKIKLSCKIQRQDSINIYFSILKNGVRVNTYIQKGAYDSILLVRPVVPKNTKNENDTLIHYDRLISGIGYGNEFGGLGGNLFYYPQKNIGIFLGFGDALAGIGVNSGIKLRYVSNKRKSLFIPFLIAMYGYNTSIYVTGTTQFNKLFYGTTVGAGFDFHLSRHSNHYWTISVLMPQRSSAVNNYINDLTINKCVTMSKSLSTITYAIGYRFILM